MTDELNQIWKLETKRTRLREWTVTDLTVLKHHFTDKDVMRYIGERGHCFSDEEINKIYAFFRDHYEKRGFGPWAVTLTSDASIVGVAGLKYMPHLENCDLGFSLFKPYWGLGLATEVAHAVLCFGFNSLGLKKIGAVTDPLNTGSVNVLKKLGMTFDKKTVHRNMDSDVYVIHRSEFKVEENI